MLENKCPTCGRNLGSGYKCPVCSVYIPPKQDMKKPTKEQIEKVAFELFNANFCAMTEADWEWWPDRIKNYYRLEATVAILEWEKIRNSPK